jgi:hypothetical protein
MREKRDGNRQVGINNQPEETRRHVLCLPISPPSKFRKELPSHVMPFSAVSTIRRGTSYHQDARKAFMNPHMQCSPQIPDNHARVKDADQGVPTYWTWLTISLARPRESTIC